MSAFDYLSPDQQAQAYYLYQKYTKEQKKKRRHGLILGGILAGNVIGAKMALSKSDKPPKPVMTDTQLRHRKKIQAQISTAGSISGLAGLSGLGTAALIRRKPGLFAKIPKAQKAIKLKGADKVANDLKDKSYVAGSVATGVGGIGGLNFAAIQRAESRKRNR